MCFFSCRNSNWWFFFDVVLCGSRVLKNSFERFFEGMFRAGFFVGFRIIFWGFGLRGFVMKLYSNDGIIIRKKVSYFLRFTPSTFSYLPLNSRRTCETRNLD